MRRMKRNIEVMRGIMEEEERTSDPETLQLLREIARSVMEGPQGTVGGR